jgi:hypothetical protein
MFMLSLSGIRPHSSNCPECLLHMPPDAPTCFCLTQEMLGSLQPPNVLNTKPLDIAPADQRTHEFQECPVDIVLPLVANFQPPKTAQPRHCPLHHPTVVPQLLARLHTAMGDAWGYAPLRSRLPTARLIAALIGMPPLGPLAVYRHPFGRMLELVSMQNVGYQPRKIPFPALR